MAAVALSLAGVVAVMDRRSAARCLLLVTALVGCTAPPPTPPSVAQSLECTVVGDAGEPGALERLGADVGSPLVVAYGGVISCACTDPRRHGGADEDRRHGGDDEDRRHGGGDEARLHGSDDEDRRHGADDEQRRHGGDDEARRHGADDEDRRHGGDDEARRHGGDDEDRRFAGAASNVHCTTSPECPGFLVDLEGPFEIFDGKTLRASNGPCVPL